MFLSEPSPHESTPLPPAIYLTRRQRECLQYIADGHTACSIGYLLGISERMVRSHLEGARLRLGAGSTTQAVYLATKAGFID